MIEFMSQPTASCLAVSKWRLQRKFRLDGFGDHKEVPLRGPASLVDRGVFAELARIEAVGTRYWSLAFEAFPNNTELFEHFNDVVSRFLTTYPGPALTPDCSMSYPAWLISLAKGTISKARRCAP